MLSYLNFHLFTSFQAATIKQDQFLCHIHSTFAQLSKFVAEHQ